MTLFTTALVFLAGGAAGVYAGIAYADAAHAHQDMKRRWETRSTYRRK